MPHTPAAPAITPAEHLAARIMRMQQLASADMLSRAADHLDLPSAPQYPPAYDWHLGPAWEDAAVLEARAQNVEGDIDEIVKLMLRANDRGDLAEYDRLEEAFALADRELALLSRRIEDLT